jgi:NTE family protein
MVNILGQSIAIMGQQLGRQETARADVVIRPSVGNIGATDFEQKNQAILEGEKAALAAIPTIRAKLAAMAAARQAALAPVP